MEEHRQLPQAQNIQPIKPIQQNTKNKYLYIIILILFLLLLVSYGYIFFDLKKTPIAQVSQSNQPTQVIPTTTKIQTTKMLQRKIGDWDYSSEAKNIFVISNDLGISMPKDVGVSGGTVVIYKESKFLINTDQKMVAGLCGMDESENLCDAYDETLPNIETLRIWRRNKSDVFAINPQSIRVNGKYLGHLDITKLSPNEYFTNDELIFWKEVLKNIVSLN